MLPLMCRADEVAVSVPLTPVWCRTAVDGIAQERVPLPENQILSYHSTSHLPRCLSGIVFGAFVLAVLSFHNNHCCPRVLCASAPGNHSLLPSDAVSARFGLHQRISLSIRPKQGNSLVDLTEVQAAWAQPLLTFYSMSLLLTCPPRCAPVCLHRTLGFSKGSASCSNRKTIS